MSAWRVGQQAGASVTRAQARAQAVTPGAPAPAAAGEAAGGEEGALQAALGKLTKWIPGDVIALYVAAVTALAAAKNAQPSVALLIVFIVVTPLFVILSAFAASGSVQAKILLPAILAAVAFTLWSLSVPLSGWQRWSFVHDHQAVVAIAAAIVAILYGFLAEGLTKRLGGS